MRKLIEFIIARRHWFLFIILETIAFLLLLNNNMYKKTMSLYINNKITGNISQALSKYKEYVDLKEKNINLLSEVARLEGLYLQSLQDFEDYKARTTSTNDIVINHNETFKYITARIININKYQDNSFFIIDKGRDDGLREDLGVVSSSGIVGSIMRLSAHYSIVIPIINPMIQTSCRILGKGYTGSLSVDKRYTNSAILSDVPSHLDIRKGDTIITSGYSDIFPKGLMVGTITTKLGDKNSSNNYFEDYRVHLSTNFDNIDYVYVILTDKNLEVDSLIQQIKSK